MPIKGYLIERRGPRFVHQGDSLEGKYLVTWVQTTAHRSATVFYRGWWQQYGEPIYAPTRADALLMSRGGAYRVASRLRDPVRWGGVEAKVISASKEIT